MSRIAAACALACLCLAACAANLSGIVYIDRNGDHVRQDDEPGVPGAVVMVDHGLASTRTDAKGHYAVDTAAGGDVVWVRVPAGFRPGAVWARADGSADLGLTPLTADEDAAPLSFVVAADTHTPVGNGVWDGGDLADGIDQALALPDAPRFFTIVGDVTQSNNSDEFARVEDTLRGIAVPWIPVAGNHDWYDGGKTWRGRWGPDNYSFDVKNLHVVVWDTNLPEDQQVAFFQADLAGVPPGMIVVALGHASPTDAVADQLSALGVHYMFTGHWHANRRVERDGLVEWGTQTMMMGTIDQSPSGYRIVTFVDDQPIVEHRARLVEPELAVTAPHGGSCTALGDFDVLVSAALDAATPAVTARIDCGPALPLQSRGGWSFGARVPALAAGTHSLTVRAEAPSGRRVQREIAFEVCAPSLGTPVAADWPQLGGGAEHTNAAAKPIAPPLQQAWATSVGGNVVLGTPVIAAGTVVVSVWDLGAGDRGGLVALDLATGAEKWRYTTPFQARNAPAIEGDTVVVALANGEVHAVGLADGAQRWVYDASDGLDSLAAQLWAPPTIAGGVVYVAVQGRASAIDLATGDSLWAHELTPEYAWLGSLAAVTVSDGSVITNVSRQDGMTAWAAATGAMQWQVKSAKSVAIMATPIANNGDLYYINSQGTVTAASVTSSATLWSTPLFDGATDWDYTVTATPALAGGRLFVPTQDDELFALDAATGIELWRYETPGGPLNFAHYRAAEPGFPASPVVTGDIVWVPRPDGTLAALAAADGHELWTTQLGAPIVSAPAPAGDYLVVATFDGTVRALVPAPAAVTPLPVDECDPLPDPDGPDPALPPAGCCGAGEGSSSSGILAGLVGVIVMRRRRRATS